MGKEASWQREKEGNVKGGTRGGREKQATKGRGCTKCEQKGCGQFVSASGNLSSTRSELATIAQAAASQASSYRDRLGNLN